MLKPVSGYGISCFLGELLLAFVFMMSAVYSTRWGISQLPLAAAIWLLTAMGAVCLWFFVCLMCRLNTCRRHRPFSIKHMIKEFSTGWLTLFIFLAAITVVCYAPPGMELMFCMGIAEGCVFSWCLAEWGVR